MTHSSELNLITERLAQLETNQAFQEESIESLEKTVAQQYQTIQQLEHKLKLLSEYLKNMKQQGGIKHIHEETPPPHY
ncbi:MAG: SlyX family protein [Thiomicrorhabdus sp.]|nr:SlyX family protein [Thiomicrorhabdus sp.]